jgi:flagellar hook protein FlgE
MANTGGINPSQVGLGVQLAGIDTLTTQGMMQPTGNNLDFAVDGDGYFMVGSGPETFTTTTTTPAAPVAGAITVNNTGASVPASVGVPASDPHDVLAGSGMNISYTRDGSFTLDNSGNLLTSDGYRVLGYSVAAIDPATSVPGTPVTMGLQSLDTNAGTPPGPINNYVDATNGVRADDGELKTLKIPDQVWDPSANGSGGFVRLKTFSVGKDGVITGVLEDGRVTALGQIAMATFKNPAGLSKTGKNLYEQTSNSGTASLKIGSNPFTGTDNSKGYGDIQEGMLEMSNVDLAEQFTDMIVTSRAFQASGKMITTGDDMLQDIINLKR